MKKTFTKKDTLLVKGVAIIAMLFFHCYTSKTDLTAYSISYAPFVKESVLRMAVWSRVCVGIYVFLSAYGMVFSLKKMEQKGCFDKENIAFYSVRRVWKILSGFWVIYVLVMIGCVIWAPESFKVYKTGYARILYAGLDFFGLSDILGTPRFIGTWWYLGLAFVEILLVPVLYGFYKRYGAFVLIGISYLLPAALGLDMTDLIRWLPAMTLGIWIADKNILAEVKAFEIKRIGMKATRVIEAFAAFVLLFFTYRLRFSEFGKSHLNIVDSVTPLVVILVSYIFIANIPLISQFLCLLGQHSMNIFLFHNFIRARWFEEFTYSFHYWWLIVIVLICDCLLISIFIEKVKVLIHYNDFVMWVERKFVCRITGK